jgi:hypothetical protein
MTRALLTDILPPVGQRVVEPRDLSSVVRDASVFGPDFRGDEKSLAAALRFLLESLAEEGIPHVLVGGLALLQHVPGRNTRDVDLIVAPGDASTIAGFIEEERNEWFATGRVGPLRVDLLFTANPLFALVAAAHGMPMEFHGVTLQVATPFGMVLLKLFALPSLYRQGDIARAKLYEADLQSLCLAHSIDDVAVLDLLSRYMSESDVNALRQIMTEIRESLRRNPFQ